MIFFIANTICYANTACDGLIKSICYREAKRGRWDFRITGRVREACGFVIRHHFTRSLIPSPHRLPPLPLDPSSQSGFTIVDSRPCMLLTRSMLRAPNPSGSPLLLPACGGLGAPREAAATQARLSQLMQKQEKSFGKVTVYHRCTFFGRSALLASFKACQLFYLLKVQNIIVATAFKDCCFRPINLTRCHKYWYILCKAIPVWLQRHSHKRLDHKLRKGILC